MTPRKFNTMTGSGGDTNQDILVFVTLLATAVVVNGVI